MKILKNAEKSAKKFLIALLKVFVKQESIDVRQVDIFNVNRVLIVHLDRKVGNLILSTPMIEATKIVFPNASIDILIATQVEVLLEANPFLNNIIEFNHTRFIKNPFKLFFLINRLRKINYEVGIESSNPAGSSFLNGFITYLSSSKYRIGFAGGGGEIFTNIHINANKNDHYFLSKQKLVEVFYNQNLNLIPKIFTDKNEIAVLKSNLYLIYKLDKSKKIIGIWIGARDKKKWDIKNFLSIYNRILISSNYFPILLFGIEEQTIFNQMDKEKNFSLSFVGLKELKNFISCCDIFISGDTGPLHFAYALGITTIGIFLQDNYGTYGYSVEGKNFIISPKETNKMINEVVEICEKLENEI